MTGFELRISGISGIGSDRSINLVATTARLSQFLTLNVKL